MIDTSPEADAVVIENLRAMTVTQRIAQVRSLSSLAIGLSKRAIARAHPDWTQDEREVFFVELHYGKELAEGYREYLMSCKQRT